jgi:hypothetical protein
MESTIRSKGLRSVHRLSQFLASCVFALIHPLTVSRRSELGPPKFQSLQFTLSLRTWLLPGRPRQPCPLRCVSAAHAPPNSLERQRPPSTAALSGGVGGGQGIVRRRVRPLCRSTYSHHTPPVSRLCLQPPLPRSEPMPLAPLARSACASSAAAALPSALTLTRAAPTRSRAQRTQRSAQRLSATLPPLPLLRHSPVCLLPATKHALPLQPLPLRRDSTQRIASPHTPLRHGCAVMLLPPVICTLPPLTALHLLPALLCSASATKHSVAATATEHPPLPPASAPCPASLENGTSVDPDF